MKHKWIKNFLDFMSPDYQTPANLRSQVLRQIQQKLSPSFLGSFQKFFLSQALAGVATLFVCPQFGSGFIHDNGNHFIHTLMSYGHWACAAFCAALFIGFASLAAFFVLRVEEIKVLRQKAWISIGIPPLAYLAIFVTMRNPESMHSDCYISPEYIVTWYIVAVVIVAFLLFAKTSKYRLGSS
jgi:hypothetical protein